MEDRRQAARQVLLERETVESVVGVVRMQIWGAYVWATERKCVRVRGTGGVRAGSRVASLSPRPPVQPWCSLPVPKQASKQAVKRASDEALKPEPRRR